MLSLTNGRLETITVVDTNTASQNMPIDESEDVLIEAPHILSRLGIVKAGTVWKTRRNIDMNQKGTRTRQEERDR
eukprot:6243221-Prorocentrum_lima.AAC.1